MRVGYGWVGTLAKIYCYNKNDESGRTLMAVYYQTCAFKMKLPFGNTIHYVYRYKIRPTFCTMITNTKNFRAPHIVRPPHP